MKPPSLTGTQEPVSFIPNLGLQLGLAAPKGKQLIQNRVSVRRQGATVHPGAAGGAQPERAELAGELPVAYRLPPLRTADKSLLITRNLRFLTNKPRMRREGRWLLTRRADRIEAAKRTDQKRLHPSCVCKQAAAGAAAQHCPGASSCAEQLLRGLRVCAKDGAAIMFRKQPTSFREVFQHASNGGARVACRAARVLESAGLHHKVLVNTKSDRQSAAGSYVGREEKGPQYKWVF